MEKRLCLPLNRIKDLIKGWLQYDTLLRGPTVVCFDTGPPVKSEGHLLAALIDS